MKTDIYFPSSDKLSKTHAVEWTPDGEVKYVLQIVHGMTEHIGRYERFAEYLNTFGFAVVGEDHIGHGDTAPDDEHLGYFGRPDGFAAVVEDIHTLRGKTAEKYPGVPYFILGHSMGSFLTRQYLVSHAEGLSGAVIMGTGSQSPAVLAAGIFMTKFIALFKGWFHRSKFVDNIAFGSYLKRIPDAVSSHDWLTKDLTVLERYASDNKCTFKFTLDGFYNMFSGIKFIQKKKNIEKIPKDTKILMVSGDEDPVGNYGAGVRKAYEAYKNAGIKDITLKLYPGDRHEILNETDKDNVYNDIKEWMIKNA